MSRGEASRTPHASSGSRPEVTDLLAELELRGAQQAAVAQLGERALDGIDAEELMQEAVRTLTDVLEVEFATVSQRQAPGALVVRAAHGFSPSADEDLAELDSRSACAYAVLTGRPVPIEDWEAEAAVVLAPEMRNAGVRSGLSVPIDGPDGPAGALGVQARRPRSYGDGDIAFVQAIANVLADALRREQTEEMIRHGALHDPLTALPNRALFLDRVEQALARLRRPHTMVAVLCLDLDHFKLVNDSLGHARGDELLAAIAPRLRDAVDPGDTVARFGGDEFGILLEEIADVAAATRAAQRLEEALQEPVMLAGGEHYVTASIGIALGRGEATAAELVRDADAAMYRSKERGRSRYELFDELLHARAASRLRVENGLRRALEREELLLLYQPLVALPDQHPVAVEALLRWDHPELGVMPTCDFIGVAEENGLIEPIGRWVLEQACSDAIAWAGRRREAPPLALSVNLSPLQVATPSFPESVAEVLGRTGLDPSLLHLEITETVMLREGPALIEALAALKALGVNLMLDDFGTGYSSLAYLAHLPLDALKVDRSFIDGLGADARDTAITEAIVAMSAALDLTVVGEGVENATQAAELRRLGCDMAQGFWFSPPLDAFEVARLLELPRHPLGARPDAGRPGRRGETLALPQP